MKFLEYLHLLRIPIIWSFWAAGAILIIVVTFNHFFYIDFHFKVKRHKKIYQGPLKCKWENTYRK